MTPNQSKKGQMTRRILIIGGGAAGLIAAGEAALAGAEVVILEKKRLTGRKLGLTGKGRCNLTNSAPLEAFMEVFGPNGRFLRQAFMQFGNTDLVAFVEQLGVPIDLERGGRFFPVDNRAPEIARAILKWCVAAGVTIKTATPAQQLIIEDDHVVGVEVGRRTQLKADAVIIATGGLSYPDTGSDGDGYIMAEAAGHSVVPTRPALIPIETRGSTAQKLQGLSLRNVTARLYIDDRLKSEQLGEMVFTHFGLSGPIILFLSGVIVDALRLRKKVEISFDLKPGLDERKLEARLLRDFATDGKKQLQTILKGLLPPKLIPVCLNLNELPSEVTGNQVNTAERRRLRHWLKDFRFEVSGYRPIDEAIITAGGVNLKEIDPRTMASRIVSGLYFAGEVLDLNGPTGGYNLQVAFSTGWLAGRSAAAGPD